MAKQFKETESFAHKTAKNLLSSWLRQTAGVAGHDNYASFGALHWRVNRAKAPFGIWEEYPACSNCDGIDPVWDEEMGHYTQQPPTFDQLLAEGYKPSFVFDIAVQHKGCISAVIEVVHKNPPDIRKRRFVQRNVGSLFVVPASWILGQIAIPAGIPEQFRI